MFLIIGSIGNKKPIKYETAGHWMSDKVFWPDIRWAGLPCHRRRLFCREAKASLSEDDMRTAKQGRRLFG